MSVCECIFSYILLFTLWRGWGFIYCLIVSAVSFYCYFFCFFTYDSFCLFVCFVLTFNSLFAIICIYLELIYLKSSGLYLDCFWVITSSYVEYNHFKIFALYLWWKYWIVVFYILVVTFFVNRNNITSFSIQKEIFGM